MFKFFTRKSTPSKKSRELADEWRASGQLDVLKQALDAGLTSSTALGDARETPLHIAARQGHVHALVLLNSRGARDSVPDGAGQFAVHHAAALGQSDCALYLLKNLGSNVDAVDAEGRTPLALVVQGGQLDMVKLLVARGADAVHARSQAGLAPLHLCTTAEVLRYLCRFTLAWVDQPDAQGRTLLMHAAQRGHKGVISEALALGADISRADHRSRNALHFAASHGRVAVIPLLVVGGCSSNEADAEGFTAVELALLAQDAQSTYKLYCAGALFTKQQLLLMGILLENSSLRQSLAEQQLRAGASHEAAAPPSGLTVSCGAVPFAPLTARAFRRKMAALPDPVPRPPRTDAVTQLTVAYSRLLRSSKDDAARDSASAVSRPLAQASASDASAHLRHTASDPALVHGPPSPSKPAPAAPTPALKRAKDARTSRDVLPPRLPTPPGCPPPRMSAYCGPTSQPLFNVGSTFDTLGGLHRPLSPMSRAAPDRGRSMAVTASDAADVGASSFWGRGKVLPRRMRASSESNGRRSSLLGNRNSTYKRRDPWADATEATDKPPRGPAPHDDLAVLRLSLSRRASNAEAEDGIAEFEDMMARRVALFQKAAFAQPK